MDGNNRQIIADRVAARLGWIVCIVAIAVGLAAALYYARLGLTLSHYDARAHLVVARRITDSLTPGWRQIGAVWLPLPHLVGLPLVQWDWAYRTGALNVLVSILSVAGGLGVLAAYLARRAGTTAGALAAPAVVLLNPNVLYLQSTPMTEPLLFGLSCLALVTVDAWVEAGAPASVRRAGWTLVALTLTRYEGWAIAGALIAIGAWAVRERGARAAFALVPYVAAAVIGFFVLGWATTGRWFTASGFFVPDNPARHRPLAVIGQILGPLTALEGWAVAAAAAAGAAAVAWRARHDARALLPLALASTAALPAAAFYEGHPFRVRYMVPLVVASGALAGLAIAALPRRLQVWTAAALCAVAVWQRPPLAADAPMVREAQWEAPYRAGREDISRYLDEHYDGTPILASMGALAHYMQDASQHGLDLADFVHEGNGQLWQASLDAPIRHVRWILIEERAEGGGVVAARARARPDFLDGYTRVAEGGGAALYRRER